MATSDRRRLSTALKFFKVILDPLADTLRIPPEFLRRYGQNLPNPIFLKVPSGSAMEVELIRSNGETLLQKGWKDFKERYSIASGHFLIFKYNGNSQFDVLIFDMSATEINYPSDSEADDSIVVLEHLSTRRGKAKIVEHSDVSIQILDINPNTRKRRVKLEDSISEECSERQCPDSVRKQRAVSKDTSIAYQKATAFASAHTLCSPFFISLMQPSYVSAKFSLNVPMTLAQGNTPRKGTNLTLRIRNGKTWSVRCNKIRATCAKMSSGWKGFVEDNGLKVGDACIFEVAKDCVWNVVIFRS